MIFEQLIGNESVLCNVQARSKKHCLEIISELVVRTAPVLVQEDLFGALIDRERLGSTSIGNGVAFPRCRADGIQHSIAAFIKLIGPVDFDASDGEAVDLVFCLVVPQEMPSNHCTELDEVTAILRDPITTRRLRECNTSKDLYETLRTVFSGKTADSSPEP
jgi:PTS system nitrogen regulatory IIA component